MLDRSCRTLAEAVLARGDKLVANARDARTVKDLLDRYPNIGRSVALDVTREGSAATARRRRLVVAMRDGRIPIDDSYPFVVGL
jgi:hypothetical protein